MSMTNRDYQIVAESIRTQRQSYDDEIEVIAIRALDRLALHLAVHFERDNPRFNRERFINTAKGGERR